MAKSGRETVLGIVAVSTSSLLHPSLLSKDFVALYKSI